jgi:hypothetical protein
MQDFFFSFLFFRSVGVVGQTIEMRRFMSLAEAVAPASGSAGESLPPTSPLLLISLFPARRFCRFTWLHDDNFAA